MAQTDDFQGHFMKIPYDWRAPTLARLRQRLWQPGGPVLRPKVFGWGWTFNLANPLSWALLGAILLAALALLIFG